MLKFPGEKCLISVRLCFPQFTFNNPISSVRCGLATNGQEFFLPLELRTRLGSLGIGLETGPNFHLHAPNEWDHGVAVGHSMGKLELIGKIHGTAFEHFRHDDLIFNVGLRYHIREGYMLLLAVGRSIHDDDTTRVRRSSYVRLQTNF